MATNGTQTSVRTIMFWPPMRYSANCTNSLLAWNANLIMLKKATALRNELDLLQRLPTIRPSGTLTGMLSFKWKIPYLSCKEPHLHDSLNILVNSWRTTMTTSAPNPKRCTTYRFTGYLWRPFRILKPYWQQWTALFLCMCWFDYIEYWH